MNIHKINRCSWRTGQRLVPGLLLAVVVNLAAQPCAMALERADTCVHCPPAHEGPMAMHHGQTVATDKMPCVSAPGACDVSSVGVDGRSGQLKFKDVNDLPVAVSGESAALLVRYPKYLQSSVDPPAPAVAAPPVRVLFCVYLK